MTLNEALARIKERKGQGQAKAHALICGFQPMHLATFLNATLAETFPGDHVEIETDLYGDFAGNLERAADSDALAAAVVMEWSDVDPRLGLRSAGGWSHASQRDIGGMVEGRFERFTSSLEKLGKRMPVAISAPSLPLPPIGHTIRAQTSVLELELEHALDSFLLRVARLNGVRVVDREYLNQLSPSAGRLDAKMELLAGFPYTTAHAAALAGCVADVLYPRPPKKALITDLDNTLWSGIVGEIGPEAISWHQDSHSQTHGLYQQMLSHLADCGVLIGVSSKNELPVVETALGRSDLLIQPDKLFPVRASWGPKSKAVAEILSIWNIAADSVVFVDDNPMELEEVAQALPGITCRRFPGKDAVKLWSLLTELRDLFGKPVLGEEDALRAASIRASSEIREAGASPDFLAGLGGVVTIDYRKDPADKRPLELINKTNQFNLNGLRMSEGEWQRCLAANNSVLAVVSYRDKFGPLGKIGTVLGERHGNTLKVSHWVMSCRAFSRNIEHRTIASLFNITGVDWIEFAFTRTNRNGPLQEFFAQLDSQYTIARNEFESQFPDLPHEVVEVQS